MGAVACRLLMTIWVLFTLAGPTKQIIANAGARLRIGASKQEFVSKTQDWGRTKLLVKQDRCNGRHIALLLCCVSLSVV